MSWGRGMNWRVIYSYKGGEARSNRLRFGDALSRLRIFADAFALEHVPTGFRIARRFLTRSPFRPDPR